MQKTLLYRFFGVGRIPGALRAELESEGILLADEGIGGWQVNKNLRAPGRMKWYEVRSFTGFLAVTKHRLVAQTYGTRQLDVPLDDARLSAVRASSPTERRITLSFDYETFRPGWRGLTELRFNTPKASAFYETLTGLGLHADGAGLSVQRGLR